uniref:Uncharacterized protein n=1 Tax=Vespula pensylvanica TaxID=30213 RepID=A0A834P1M6_VESPE|nr:hypothetical protein H0235_007618 [Vespula pensylvanica]
MTKTRTRTKTKTKTRTRLRRWKRFREGSTTQSNAVGHVNEKRAGACVKAGGPNGPITFDGGDGDGDGDGGDGSGSGGGVISFDVIIIVGNCSKTFRSSV